MATPSIPWLSENALRSFPLMAASNKAASTGYVLPQELILDALLINTGSTSQEFTLSSIDATANPIIFNFSNNISFSASNSLTGIQYLRGTNNSGLTINASILSSIPPQLHFFTNLYVEPSICIEYQNLWKGVTGLTATPSFTTASNNYLPALPLSSVGSPTTLNGDLELYEGFYFGIDFNTTTNGVDFYSGNSYGVPIDCSMYFLSAASDCANIVSYINGVSPDSSGNFTIAPGPNINFILGTTLANFYDNINTTLSANSHTIFVGMNFRQQDLCRPIGQTPIP